jgi:hypothetical protein
VLSGLIAFARLHVAIGPSSANGKTLRTSTRGRKPYFFGDRAGCSYFEELSPFQIKTPLSHGLLDRRNGGVSVSIEKRRFSRLKEAELKNGASCLKTRSIRFVQARPICVVQSYQNERIRNSRPTSLSFERVFRLRPGLENEVYPAFGILLATH